MKILYFTASGNSLAVAKRFDAELLSIPQLLKLKQFEISDDSIGIIYPVYGFSLPNIVKTYLKQCHLKSDYIFVIATYGNADGATLHEMKRVLRANGNDADYYDVLLMVDNYLPIFEISDQISKLKEKRTEEQLNRIVEEVKRREKKDTDKGFAWNTVSAAMGAVSGSIIKSRARRWFRVSDGCVGCGICVKVCPVSNVHQTEKKPTFGNKCESCFACVHNCPQKAIHLKNEKSGERFRNSNVSLTEIIKANHQNQL